MIGVEAIRNKVKGLNLLGAKIDISKGFVDFQEFDVNRVLVVVVGVFTAAGQSPRQFTQTFVLAGQDVSQSPLSHCYPLLKPYFCCVLE